MKSSYSRAENYAGEPIYRANGAEPSLKDESKVMSQIWRLMDEKNMMKEE